MRHPRQIELPGCSNLRDLGGYPTRSGATVRWRHLYRSGISRVNRSAAEVLVGELGIRRVIDLRTPIEGRASRWPLSSEYQQVNVPLLTSFRSHWVRPSDQRPQAIASRYLEMLEQGLPSIRRILSLLIAVPQRPTLIHCAAGRDRTGIVIAVLLDLLNVPEEVIATDYALSDSSISDDEPAQPETIHSFLNLLRQNHTSTRSMLMRSGVSVASIHQLQHALLDSTSGASLFSETEPQIPSAPG